MSVPIVPGSSEIVAPNESPLPAMVAKFGRARFAWDEFFHGEIGNAYTRKNYLHAVRRFTTWAEERGLELVDIEPGHVGMYFQELRLAVPTKKLHLAALRKFFDRLTVRHVVVINPAATVRTERYSVVEGKTPEIRGEQVRKLLASIDISTCVGLRDRAILAVLIYTAARVGAVARLHVKSFQHDGTQYSLRFEEKGGKSREIPVRHDLERFVRDYLEKTEIADGPLFRTALGKTGRLSGQAITGIDICRMMKRRLRAAGLPLHFSRIPCGSRQ
jgi:integrase/recombinase XerD